MTKEAILETLQRLTPLINKNWLPIFNSAHSNLTSRSKFTPIDDGLLLIGLKKYGPRNIDKIQKNFLQEKSMSEIRNRYKNLICSKAVENPIKKWKKLQSSHLSDVKNFSESKIILKVNVIRFLGRKSIFGESDQLVWRNSEISFDLQIFLTRQEPRFH